MARIGAAVGLLAVVLPAAADGPAGAGQVMGQVLSRARAAGALARVTGVRAFAIERGGRKELLVLRGLADGETFRLTGCFGPGSSFLFEVGPDGTLRGYAARATEEEGQEPERLRGAPVEGGFRRTRTAGGTTDELPPSPVAVPVPDMLALFVLPALADQGLPDALEHHTLAWDGAVFLRPSTLRVDARGAERWVVTLVTRRGESRVEVGATPADLGRLLRIEGKDGTTRWTATPVAEPPADRVKVLEAEEALLAK